MPPSEAATSPTRLGLGLQKALGIPSDRGFDSFDQSEVAEIPPSFCVLENVHYPGDLQVGFWIGAEAEKNACMTL